MFLQIDGTLVVQVVNLIVFLIVLDAVFFKPVGAAIAERRAYINGLAADIEGAEADVRAMRGQADAKRAAARREADEMMARARAAAQTEAVEIVAAYAQRAQDLVDAAQKTVAGEVATARAKESDVVASLAQTLLERAVGPGTAA